MIRRVRGGLVGALAAALLVLGLASQRTAPGGVQVHTPRRGFVTSRDAGMALRAWAWQLDPGVRWEFPGDRLALRPKLAPDGRLWLSRGRSRVELDGDGSLRAQGLDCSASVRWPGRRLMLDGTGLYLDEERVCSGAGGSGAGGSGAGGAADMALEAGRRRVQLGGLVLEGQPQGSRLPVWLLGLGLLLGAGLGAAGRLRGALLLPLLLGSALVWVDGAAVAEALWVQELASGWLPFGVGVGGALLLGGLLGLLPALRGGPFRAWLWALALAGWAGCLVLVEHDGGQVALGLLGLTGLAAASVGLGARVKLSGGGPVANGALWAILVTATGLPADPFGVLGVGCLGLALAWIVAFNLNAARLPSFNLLSLGGALVLLVGLELGVAHSHPAVAWRAALTWNGRYAQALDADDVAVVAIDDFSSMERGRHTAYPARGYPVAAGPRQAPLRIVCVGGSSTGGAWQFDDLDLFYPARLDAILGPEVEVINQGVGGWTSWHVVHYLEVQLDALQADILTVYLGNNDAGFGYPAPISQLHTAWLARQQRGPVRLLESLALVEWLRVALAPRMQPRDVPAVTIAEHRQNLARIIELAGTRPVLLIGEANSAGGEDLQGYYAQQRALAAASPTVAYLHGPQLLPADEPGLFLDYAHPTEAGHQRLAEGVAAALRAQGWAP